MSNNDKNNSNLEKLEDFEMDNISGGTSIKQKLSAGMLAGLAFGNSTSFANSNSYEDYYFSIVSDFEENENLDKNESKKPWLSVALKSILGVTVAGGAITGVVYLVNKIITATNFEEAFDSFDEIIDNFENKKCSSEAVLKACEEFEKQLLKELQKREIKISKKAIDFKSTSIKDVLIYIKDYLEVFVNNIDNNVKNENLKTKINSCIVKLNQIIAKISDIPKQNTNHMSDPEKTPHETAQDDTNQNEIFQRSNPHVENIEPENVQPISYQVQTEELEEKHEEKLSLEEFTEKFNNMCIEFCDKYCRSAIDDFSGIKPIFDEIVKFVEDYNPEFLFVWDGECIAGSTLRDNGKEPYFNVKDKWKTYSPIRLKYVHDLERFREETKMDDITYRTTLLNFVAQFFWNINEDRKDNFYWVNDSDANARRYKSLGILIEEYFNLKQQRPVNNEYVKNNLWNTVKDDVLAFIKNYYTLYFEGVDWSWNRCYKNERYEDSGMNLRLCVGSMYNILTKLYSFPYAFDIDTLNFGGKYDNSNPAVMYMNIAQTLRTMHDFFDKDVTFGTGGSSGEQDRFLKPLKQVFDKVMVNIIAGIGKSYPKVQSVARNGICRMVSSPESKNAINRIEQEIKEVAEQAREEYKYTEKYNDLVDECRIENRSSLLLGSEFEY